MTRRSKNKNIPESSNVVVAADDVFISQETQNLPQLEDGREANTKHMLEIEETI